MSAMEAHITCFHLGPEAAAHLQAKILKAIIDFPFSHLSFYPAVSPVGSAFKTYPESSVLITSILVWAIILSHQNYCNASNWSPCFHCYLFSTISQTDPFKTYNPPMSPISLKGKAKVLMRPCRIWPPSPLCLTSYLSSPHFCSICTDHLDIL